MLGKLHNGVNRERIQVGDSVRDKVSYGAAPRKQRIEDGVGQPHIRGVVVAVPALERGAAADPWGMPIMFAAFTGARQAEVLGLNWSDIDWNRRTAEIRRQWRRGAFYEPRRRPRGARSSCLTS